MPEEPQPSSVDLPLRGLLLGASAALILALADFGALWLWLPRWSERAGFFFALLALLLPIGALLGALLGGLGVLAAPALARLADRLARRGSGRGEAALGEAELPERRARWLERLAPLPYVALAAPALLALAYLLFTGGRMSRLPGRPALVVAAALLLVAALWAALGAARALLRRSRAGRGASLAIGLGALGLGFGLAKIDQHVLPTHYAYLHGALSVSWAGLAALAVAALAAQSSALQAADRRRRAVGVAVGLLALVGLGFDLVYLDDLHSVRASLMDPRAATARSTLEGVGLAFGPGATARASAAAIERARQRRADRRRSAAQDDLPATVGAHVVLVTVDALRADHLGAYGYRRGISPHLDAFARESVVFERAYAQAPHSSFSLCSVMTSEYLHERVELGHALPDETLATLFAADEYRTAAFFTRGIFHTAGEQLAAYDRSSFGFATHDEENRDAEATTDRVLSEVESIVAAGEPPSLLWVHYFDVHEPYREQSLGSSEVDRYDGEIRNVDRAFHRLISGLRRRLQRPLVIALTADHGEEFGDHGGAYHGSTLYQEQIRVPLIVQAPGYAPRRVRDPVELVDLAPTLLGLVGNVPAPSMRGDDLRSLMLGREVELGPAFASVGHQRMAVAGGHKLVLSLGSGLVHLYDLDADPEERINLADAQPAQVDALRGELDAWIDALASAGEAQDPRAVALARGRLNDLRALDPLVALALDPEAPAEMRREACQILGRLSDQRVAERLLPALEDPDRGVAAEAAIAIGRLWDWRARPLLRELVQSEDRPLRMRAAIALARTRDPLAGPALIDLMERPEGPTATEDRADAIRWLGRLQIREATGPLLDQIEEVRSRQLVARALGEIGDPRAYEPLIRLLREDRFSTVCDNAARGLGMLGDRRAIAPLLEVGLARPELNQLPESLVRLGAIEAGAIGGTDLSQERLAEGGFEGLGACQALRPRHDTDYAHRTRCRTEAARAALPVRVPEALAREGAIAILTLRRADASAPTRVRLRIGGFASPAFEAHGSWEDHRFPISGPDLQALEGGAAVAELTAEEEAARFWVDHLLLLPRRNTE